MKVIQFTIPVAKEQSVIVHEEVLPHFYPHLHRHNEMQITWVLQGEGTLITGNYMHPFQAGNIFIIGANQPHIFKSDSSYFDKRHRKQVHSITFYFNPEGFFKQILELPESKDIRKLVTLSQQGLQLPARYQAPVAAELNRLKQATQGALLGGFIALLQSLASINGWKKLTTTAATNFFSEQEGLRMNDVYQYTLQHYKENISLQQVASVACLTPQAFCRYFKKHTRKTYIVFLNEIRISEACKRLVAGNVESMAAVAYGAGFNNPVSFNRVFRKITGRSPREYLQEYRQKAG